jgi:ketosteroid isomerase-like protein
MTESDMETEVRGAMRELARAFLESDVEALDETLDDDFTGYDPAGIIVSKARWLADVASGDLVFTSINADETQFRHGADFVRVSGQMTFRARYSRSNYNGSFRYLGVYAKRGDKWRLLLSTARPVPPPSRE